MKLEIKECGNNSYYDEFLYLVQNYKKIRNNSIKNVHGLFKSGYLYLVVSCVIDVLFLVLYLLKKENIFLYVVIFFSFLVVFSLVYIFMISNKIKQLKNNFKESTFEINESSVSLSASSNVTLNWNEIERIMVNKNTIVFIPKDMNKAFITMRSEYKNEILDAIKKYNKENLINK